MDLLLTDYSDLFVGELRSRPSDRTGSIIIEVSSVRLKAGLEHAVNLGGCGGAPSEVECLHTRLPWADAVLTVDSRPDGTITLRPPVPTVRIEGSDLSVWMEETYSGLSLATLVDSVKQLVSSPRYHDLAVLIGMEILLRRSGARPISKGEGQP